MRIYAGNLAATTSDTELNTAFAAHGKVESVRLVTDKDSGEFKGYGFIDMANDSEAQAAITALDGSQLNGTVIKVKEAKAKVEAAAPAASA